MIVHRRYARIPEFLHPVRSVENKNKKKLGPSNLEKKTRASEKISTRSVAKLPRIIVDRFHATRGSHFGYAPFRRNQNR